MLIAVTRGWVTFMVGDMGPTGMQGWGTFMVCDMGPVTQGWGTFMVG